MHISRCCRVAVATIGLCFVWASAPGAGAQAQEKPMYKVDPYWPKPLPNKWIMQQVPTLTVDSHDHIWVLNRSRAIRPDEIRGIDHASARRLLHYRARGARIRHGGQRSQGLGEARASEAQRLCRGQTIIVDKEGNVWLSGMGTRG